MVIFGLILLLLALAVIGYMWFATQGMAPVDIDYGILNISLEPFWLFVAGGIALAAATCGLWIMGVGAKSRARKAKEMRELRRQAKEADRRAERAGDSASLGRSSGTPAPATPRTTTAPSRTTTQPSGTAPRPTASSTSSSGQDAPILPRTPRTDGPTEGHSSLDIDRPKS